MSNNASWKITVKGEMAYGTAEVACPTSLERTKHVSRNFCLGIPSKAKGDVLDQITWKKKINGRRMTWDIRTQKFPGLQTGKVTCGPAKPGWDLSHESPCHGSSHLPHPAPSKAEREDLPSSDKQKEQGATDFHKHPIEENQCRAAPPDRSQTQCTATWIKNPD